MPNVTPRTPAENRVYQVGTCLTRRTPGRTPRYYRLTSPVGNGSWNVIMLEPVSHTGAHGPIDQLTVLRRLSVSPRELDSLDIILYDEWRRIIRDCKTFLEEIA